MLLLNSSAFQILPHMFLLQFEKTKTNPKNPEKQKTTLNLTFLPRINHGEPSTAAADFNLQVSQGGSKPIPPEVKGWFN